MVSTNRHSSNVGFFLYLFAIYILQYTYRGYTWVEELRVIISVADLDKFVLSKLKIKLIIYRRGEHTIIASDIFNALYYGISLSSRVFLHIALKWFGYLNRSSSLLSS